MSGSPVDDIITFNVGTAATGTFNITLTATGNATGAPTHSETLTVTVIANKVAPYAIGGVVLISVRADALPTGMEAVFTVTDTGIGIPTGDRDYVFDAFYRGTNVGTEVPGSGIGLAGVRQIAEMHGGTVSVESAEGAGGTFPVRLPLGVS